MVTMVGLLVGLFVVALGQLPQSLGLKTNFEAGGQIAYFPNGLPTVGNSAVKSPLSASQTTTAPAISQLASINSSPTTAKTTTKTTNANTENLMGQGYSPYSPYDPYNPQVSYYPQTAYPQMYPPTGYYSPYNNYPTTYGYTPVQQQNRYGAPDILQLADSQNGGPGSIFQMAHTVADQLVSTYPEIVPLIYQALKVEGVPKDSNLPQPLISQVAEIFSKALTQ